MKTAVLKRRINRFANYSFYPNSATPRQMLHKALDLLLMAASGAGIGALILLLLAM